MENIDKQTTLLLLLVEDEDGVISLLEGELGDGGFERNCPRPNDTQCGRCGLRRSRVPEAPRGRPQPGAPIPPVPCCSEIRSPAGPAAAHAPAVSMPRRTAR